MGELDQGAKIALQIDALSIVHLGLPGVQELRPFPQEVVAALRTTDAAFIGRVDGEEVSVQVEFEAEPTSDVGPRVTRRACALFAAHGRPVRIVVLYLHPSKDQREPKDGFTLRLGEKPLPLQFRSVPLWKLSAEGALASQLPGLLPFVALMRGATLEHVGLASRELQRLLGRRHAQRNDAEVALLLLSGTVFDEQTLRGIIRMEAVMASSLFARMCAEAEAKGKAEGEAKGKAEGEAKALRKAAEILLMPRLGSIPESLRAALGASGPAALERVLQAIAATEDDARLEANVRAALKTLDGA